MKQILKSLLKELMRQLTAKQPAPSVVFTNHALWKMRSYGLSEKQIEDVCAKGEIVKPGMKIRKYNGYEIGVIYKMDTEIKNRYIIISAWKRGRR